MLVSSLVGVVRSVLEERLGDWSALGQVVSTACACVVVSFIVLWGRNKIIAIDRDKKYNIMHRPPPVVGSPCRGGGA